VATEEIVRKLSDEIYKGITSEVQVVYLLAGIRKIIERDEVRELYPSLNFHCDWALHAHLDRAMAKSVLATFDRAQPLLKNGTELSELPRELRQPIVNIFMFDAFTEELDEFIDKYKLPEISITGVDGWARFLHLYGKVIQDIPLIVKATAPNAAHHISKIMVKIETAEQLQEIGNQKQQWFKISWVIFDKEGISCALYTLNSFSV
jgi:hypothetical protein